jgi:hypothetical protein
MVIAMRSTTIAAFASWAEAQRAVCDLRGAAFGPDQVGIVLPDAVAPTPGSEEARTTTLWAGEMFRSLIGVEIPDDETRYYEEALQEGRTLVMVRAGDRYSEAMDLLHRCGGKYMAAF